MKDQINADYNPSDAWIDDREASIDLIREERRKQFAKWGAQTHDMASWMEILMEEVGEVAHENLCIKFGPQANKEFMEQHRAKQLEEAIQVAAVAAAIVQYLQSGEA